MRIREHTLTYLMDARVFVDLEGESEDARRVSRERLGIHLYSTSMYEDTYIAYVCGHIEMRDASPASSSAFTRERLGIHSCY